MAQKKAPLENATALLGEYSSGDVVIRFIQGGAPLPSHSGQQDRRWHDNRMPLGDCNVAMAGLPLRPRSADFTRFQVSAILVGAPDSKSPRDLPREAASDLPS